LPVCTGASVTAHSILPFVLYWVINREINSASWWKWGYVVVYPQPPLPAYKLSARIKCKATNQRSAFSYKIHCWLWD